MIRALFIFVCIALPTSAQAFTELDFYGRWAIPIGDIKLAERCKTSFDIYAEGSDTYYGPSDPSGRKRAAKFTVVGSNLIIEATGQLGEMDSRKTFQILSKDKLKEVNVENLPGKTGLRDSFMPGLVYQRCKG